MNKTKATLLGMLIWVIITMIYSRFAGIANDFNSIGFPLHFYSYFASKPNNSDVVSEGTAFRIDFVPLILDLFCAIVFIVLLNVLLSKKFKPSKTNPDL